VNIPDYRLNDAFTASIGNRILEGGSDVEEVYSFTLINYFVLGINYRI